MNSSIRRCSLGSTHWSALKVPSVPSPLRTWQAILVARSSVRNLVMALAPDCPARRRAQVSSTPQASGVTRPRPVTTTLRIPLKTFERRSGSVRFVYIFDGVADGDNGFRRIVGNFDAEFFLKSHHQLDGVEAVCAQIFNEGRVVRDLVGIDIQVLDDDLLHALGSIAHGLVSLS